MRDQSLTLSAASRPFTPRAEVRAEPAPRGVGNFDAPIATVTLENLVTELHAALAESARIFDGIGTNRAAAALGVLEGRVRDIAGQAAPLLAAAARERADAHDLRVKLLAAEARNDTFEMAWHEQMEKNAELVAEARSFRASVKAVRERAGATIAKWDGYPPLTRDNAGSPEMVRAIDAVETCAEIEQLALAHDERQLIPVVKAERAA